MMWRMYVKNLGIDALYLREEPSHALETSKLVPVDGRLGLIS
jgi:hypothetical protein